MSHRRDLMFVLGQTLLEIMSSHEESFCERSLSIFFVGAFLLLPGNFAGGAEWPVRVTFL